MLPIAARSGPAFFRPPRLWQPLHVGPLASEKTAVAVGVLEDQDAVAPWLVILLFTKLAAVVDGFENPDAAALVDVDMGRVGKLPLAGP
ncbi:MAG: hypothetical protein FJW37_01445 [Acidobacteria bacterium]|nr:hypothetical protein [Acidobacteriota bacterium]